MFYLKKRSIRKSLLLLDSKTTAELQNTKKILRNSGIHSPSALVLSPPGNRAETVIEDLAGSWRGAGKVYEFDTLKIMAQGTVGGSLKALRSCTRAARLSSGNVFYIPFVELFIEERVLRRELCRSIEESRSNTLFLGLLTVDSDVMDSLTSALSLFESFKNLLSVDNPNDEFVVNFIKCIPEELKKAVDDSKCFEQLREKNYNALLSFYERLVAENSLLAKAN